MTTTQLKDGIKLLSTYSGGTFEIWALAGSSKGSCRVHVMSVLTGVKTPQAKSGVNAIRSLLMAEIKPEGNCIAIRDKNFTAYCKQLLTS